MLVEKFQIACCACETFVVVCAPFLFSTTTSRVARRRAQPRCAEDSVLGAGAGTRGEARYARLRRLARPRLGSAMGVASALAESETHASKAVEVVASRSACAREMDTGGHRLAFGIGGVHATDPKDLADVSGFADKVRSRHASLRAPDARDRRLRADLVLPPLFRTRKRKFSTPRSDRPLPRAMDSLFPVPNTSRRRCLSTRPTTRSTP